MTQAIGAILTGYADLNTQIPTLAEPADIVTAFRTYHYGSATYTYGDTNPANLNPASIAGQIYAIWQSLNAVSGSLGMQYTEFTAKGDILTTIGPGSTPLNVQPISVGTNGQVLTANSATGTGLQWVSPEVTLINSVTLTNKTLTNPTINAGLGTIVLPASASPAQTAEGSVVWNSTNDLLTVGTGASRKTMVDLDSTQALTNKTLTAPTVSQLYLSDSVVVFEGSVADAFETTLGVVNPTVDRTINLPDVDGTVITTGNLTSIITVGTVTSGSFPANNLSGTTLNSGVVSSSLTSLATVTSGTWNASVISGQYGGTGVANTGKTITLGGNLVTSGTFATTFTTTATTNVTLPTSGTLVGSADTGTVTSAMIANGTIVDADINSAAAIAKTKISGTAITAADTGTVTNTMLAGSIANNKLSNSFVILDGVTVNLGDSAIITENLKIEVLMGSLL